MHSWSQLIKSQEMEKETGKGRLLETGKLQQLFNLHTQLESADSRARGQRRRAVKGRMLELGK